MSPLTPQSPDPAARPAPARIKEKELRLALVCYGGVSLAVYQHGITKEILKLVRASRAYHAAPGIAAKQRPGHVYAPARRDGAEHSTEEVYFDFLKAIGAHNLDLRVIVDVIAGASSGGVNGIVLARALAHDLAIEPATDVWLNDVDVNELLAPEAKARWQQSATLASSVAGLFFGSNVGLAGGGAALFLNMRSMLFPKTELRSALLREAAATS